MHEEKAMLHSVLDLNDITVADIMNHRKNVFAVDILSDKNETLNKIINSDYTRIPVYRGSLDEIIGVLNIKEVFKAYAKNTHNVNLDSLIKQPYFIPETSYVLDLLLSFRNNQERLALIVDEYGSFMGIVTLGDILEEITGELKNKEQRDSSLYIQKSGNSFIVFGDIKIRDLNRKMGLQLPDEEFTTVAGLILYETGRIPNVGNIFMHHNFRFEILEKKHHQLTKIKLTPLDNNIR